MIASVSIVLNIIEVNKAEESGYEIEERLGYTKIWFSIDDVARAYIINMEGRKPNSEVRVTFSDGESLYFVLNQELIAALNMKFDQVSLMDVSSL